MSDSSDRSLNMLAAALQMEQKGREFYGRAADQAENPLARRVWRLLAEYEENHIRRIGEIYNALRAGGTWLENPAADFLPLEMGEVFKALAQEQKEHVRPETDELEALGVGIDFESASLNYYRDQLALAEDAVEKEFLETMAAEERGHLNLLTDMRAYYLDPEGWLMEKGRAGLDGA